MKHCRKIVRSLLLLAGIGLSVSSNAAPIAYTVDSDVANNLYRFDLATGSATLIGPTGVGGLEGLALSPNYQLYGVSETGSLYTINLATGAATLVGPLGVPLSDPGMTFCPNGSLYVSEGSSNAPLYSVNPATGAATLIGNTTPSIEGLACSLAGILYGIEDINGELYTINRSTAASTLIGPLGTGGLGEPGAAMSPDGTLWMVNDINGNFYSVNTTTGAATLAFTAATTGFEGLAILGESTGLPVQVPTLSHYGLILLAALIAFLARRKIPASA